jgi:endonuclease/exonuclease/phosphatase family metal-dependent hydrolase
MARKSTGTSSAGKEGDSPVPARAKRRKKIAVGLFSPLVISTLRQERKSYVAHHGREGQGEALIASYNIHKCVGLDRRFDPYRTISVIKEIDADVIALQEADQRFGERAGLLDLSTLKRECGLVPVPMEVPQGGHGWHGNVILFRDGTVSSARQLSLPGVEPRGALVVELMLAAGPLRMIAAHLGLLRRSRTQQVKAILSAAHLDDGKPTVLVGDLNEWRMGKRSALQGLAPVFGPLQAAIPSFPSRFPVWALDRVLGNPHSVISSVELHETPLARIASDHLPIKAVINLSGASVAGRSKSRDMAAAA